MARKVAAALSLVVFAVCVTAGIGAGNSFEGVLTKALLGMAATFVVGIVVGAIAQKMIDENLAAEAAKTSATGPADADKEKLGNPERNSEPRGR